MKQTKRTSPRSVLTLALIGGVMLAPACFEGGLNLNEVNPGNQDDGVDLRFGEIAVDPTGAYFLSSQDDQLLKGNIATGAVSVLDDLGEPQRVAFGHDGESIYVTTEAAGGDRLVAWNVEANAQRWAIPVVIDEQLDQDLEMISLPRLDTTEDGAHVVVSNRQDIEILDAETGELVFSESFEHAIRDVDVTPDQDRVMVTLEHTWEGDLPNTKIFTIDIGDGSVSITNVPNCSSELVMSEFAKFAFLAPTTCSKDPVSVIELETGKFQKNMPGFGPVGISPRGELAVAFIDTLNVDASLFEEGDPMPSFEDGRYHMMFIDAKTLEFDVMPFGDELPRYAMTPNGDVLLVDSDSWFGDQRLRVLDVMTREFHEVAGPDVQLDHYAMSADGQHVWLLDEGLYGLDIPERIVSSLPVSFTPTHLNVTPDDAHVLLRENDETIWIWDVAGESISHSAQVGD